VLFDFFQHGFRVQLDGSSSLYVKKKLGWIFRTEKINIIAFRALELAIVQDLMNNGKKPSEINTYMQQLGRYFGDLLYIGYHARGGEVAESIMELGKIANSFYIYLFGEGLDKIYYVLVDKDNRVELHLVANNGIPTCREIVSPHPEIKFGSFIVGAVMRMLELKRDELEYIDFSCREEKCISVGDSYCELMIDFTLPPSTFSRIYEKYGGEYYVKR